MRHRIILLVVLGLALAGEAGAGANEWSIKNLYPRPGDNVSTITPTTTTGNTQSPTVGGVANCGGVLITIFGATLTATVQLCHAHYLLGAALNEAECTNMNLTGLDGASTRKGVQVTGAMPSHIRLAGVTNCTVWRWRSGKSPVPEYVWTIIRLQLRVRDLTAELCAVE